LRISGTFDDSCFPLAVVAGGNLELDGRVYRNRARAVGDLGAVEEQFTSIVGSDGAVSLGLVELRDSSRHRQCTILVIGSSMMSLAPWSFNAGIRVLMSDLGTTASTAYAVSPKSFDTVGDFMAGRISMTLSRSASPTLSFTSTRPRASSAPSSSVCSCPMACRLAGSS